MKIRFFEHFKTYRVYYYFNFGIMIGGFLCGIYLLNLQSENQLINLSQSILEMLNGSYIQDKTYVSQHLTSSLIYLLIIYLFALSISAIPFLAFLLFYKSLQLGFTASLYLYIFGAKGIIGILLTLLPYLFFEFIAYFSSFAIAYEISLSIVITTFIKRQVLSFREVITHLLNSLIWSLCFMLLSVLTQIYILPILFNIFMK